ncbi:hypothetical protein SAMN05192534_1261, partial [Alteribacillus persepolensis]
YTEGGGGETPQKETSCISWLLKNTMVTIWRDGVHGILREGLLIQPQSIFIIIADHIR